MKIVASRLLGVLVPGLLSVSVTAAASPVEPAGRPVAAQAGTGDETATDALRSHAFRSEGCRSAFDRLRKSAEAGRINCRLAMAVEASIRSNPGIF